MPKLLWVLLPLLLAAVCLALSWLARRAPNRHALNVWSSLLLLAYLATTAGLGVFWVANQQLPVFDWHYLFGYATVLLVSLHLVFNVPVVWRHFTRPAVRREAGPDAPRPRRRWFALAAAAAGVAVGFMLGRRRSTPGETESAGADNGAAAAPASTAFVERYHALSSTSRSGVVRRAPPVAWGNPPPPFKRYPAAPRQALARAAASTAADIAALGTALWHTAGVTERRGGLALRASPSSGALFSTELYVLARRLPGLAPGVWHHDAGSHALERLADVPPDAWPGTPEAAASAPALVVATAVFRRTGYKYRDRAYRYVLADLGHALENLRVAAAAAGAPLRYLTQFDEAALAALLGIDEADEGVLALAALESGAAAPSAAGAVAAWQPAPQTGRETSLPLGITSAMHRASSLRAGVPAAASAPAPAPAPVAAAIALPAMRAAPQPTLDVIAKRRSVRRFAATSLPLATLAGVLRGLDGGTFPAWSAAVRVHVVAHAVAGLAPGAYRYDAAAQALRLQRPPADLREAARAAALDQDVIGDAAAVFVLTIDRATWVADPAGPARGYRHAFLEAGMVGERIYLQAGLRGLGACAVGAFFDDEAQALIAIDPAREWVVHFAALGEPAR